MQDFYRDLIESITSKKINTPQGVIKIRQSLARKHNVSKLPSFIQILLNARSEEFPKLGFLKTKPTRTISGVAPMAIMTYPRKCDHGTCTFCPGGPGSFFGDVPQSYTGNEPASMRAKRNNYDPYLQIFNRLEQYILLNHVPEKVELIIMGGTFTSYPAIYQEEFVTYALKAMNDFSEMFLSQDLDFISFRNFFELPADIGDKERILKMQSKILEFKGKSTLGEEQLRNEKARIRCCVLNIETKGDKCKPEHITQALNLGVTRVELGVQSLNNEVLRLTNRGHTVEDSAKASQLLKDSFLKCCYHMMIGLPGSSKGEDLNNFREIFSNQDYMPDALKIYPCMVMPGTALHHQYQKGRFSPLSTEEAASLTVELKKYIPRYSRVMRIVRDIPTRVTVDGVNITNFRQYVQEIMKKKEIKCECIRCREPKNKAVNWDKVKLNRLDYESSNSWEIFLSFDDIKSDVLIGFLRMRIPYQPFRHEITENSAGIREVHCYGSATPLGSEGTVQHRGFGKMLVNEAERIAKEEFDAKKLLVISGIGTREYFAKIGFKKDGVYMSKLI